MSRVFAFCTQIIERDNKNEKEFNFEALLRTLYLRYRNTSQRTHTHTQLVILYWLLDKLREHTSLSVNLWLLSLIT